jgi:CRP-like cAMP-binding protein/ActR/RegA family two-component response regulator
MINILVIEDNAEVRENTAEILRLANYSVQTAINGKEGIELAQRSNPDLIICDIMMPVLDGYGVLYMLSKNESTSTIPFIFLTAKVERSDMRKGMEMGADDYLTKPFDDVELLNAIEIRLKKRALLNRDISRNTDGYFGFIEDVKGIDVLKMLSEERERRYFKKKEEVYKEGGFPKGVYFVGKGKIKIYQTNESGKELILDLHKEGDFFGYVSLIQNGKYTSSASALEDSEVYLIPKEDFFALLYKHVDVSRKFIEMLSNNIRENEQHLINIAYHSVRKRVAEALIKLSNTYKKEDEGVFSMNVSREDLASLAGTATETVIRTLSDFKEEKLIETAAGTIKILNYEKLALMKN